MAFNAEEFRKRASAAGLSAADIDAEIAYQSGGVKKDEPFAKNESGFQLSTPEQIHQRLGTDWWHLPVGMAIGTGLGVAGKALFDARAAKTQTPTPRVEPTLEGAGIAPPAAESVDRLQLATERAAQGRAAGLGLKPPVQAPATPIPPVAPMAAEPPAAAEVPAIAEEAPKTAAALATEQPGSQVAQAVVQDELAKPTETPKVSGAAEPPARTGSGQPAFPGGGAERARMPRGGEFASAADVPKSMAFVPGAQYYDSLANAIRSRPAAQAVVQQYGRYPASDAEARSWAADYLKSTGAPTRETMLAEGKKPDTVTGIFKEIGANKKKLAKMGGVAGALVAIADLANAKTTEEKMNAGLGVLGAIVPPGLDVLPAGAPTVPQARIEESALLGSPYAQTEWAKYMRLRERAGAGRGLVNPR